MSTWAIRPGVESDTTRFVRMLEIERLLDGRPLQNVVERR